ncbi:TIGR02391 family protein [Micromonospora sp. D93]|uniref:TIGR02391 family protein n=1 Tax=Micromonospora sp. D93 TaxID=2824886 RepID=UPI001B36C4C2|nr:TIGR02391 family protein [Micromonospora sp. D93]MBQ1020662.1 TIGR02391 family protein [Micromonospora sp. D93]
MTKLDKDWAIEQIDHFLHTTEQVAPDMRGSGITFFGTVQRGSETEAASAAHVVEQILDRVLPSWRVDHRSSGKKHEGWDHLREWAARGKVTIQRDAELRERLGDGAPEMDAGKLHPWVWESAAPLWRTQHYRQAVSQAAIQVNAETQAKIGRRDVSETDFFNQAFSLDPPKSNAPRLRVMVDDGSKTYQSLHRGVRSLAEGLYAAVRNPAAHAALGEADEQQALEQLAAFSLLARWVDSARVESVP